MPLALLALPWLAFGLAFVIAQSRFYAAYFERYGGLPADRRWRSMYFWTHPVEYLRSLRKPPFTLGSIFRRLDDAAVERRRRQYAIAAVAAFAYIPALVVVLVVGLIVYGAPVGR